MAYGGSTSPPDSCLWVHEVYQAFLAFTLITPETRTSCGVLVTDGVQVLLGQASRSPRWDIPKGLAHPGEPFVTALLELEGG
jgi:hypothetical protein